MPDKVVLAESLDHYAARMPSEPMKLSELVATLDPRLGAYMTDEQLDAALDALGDFADLKSPFFLGHSRGVAQLAAEAGATMGLSNDETSNVRRAGADPRHRDGRRAQRRVGCHGTMDPGAERAGAHTPVSLEANVRPGGGDEANPNEALARVLATTP